jgi:hypothetical protein
MKIRKCIKCGAMNFVYWFEKKDGDGFWMLRGNVCMCSEPWKESELSEGMMVVMDEKSL